MRNDEENQAVYCLKFYIWSRTTCCPIPERIYGAERTESLPCFGLIVILYSPGRTADAVSCADGPSRTHFTYMSFVKSCRSTLAIVTLKVFYWAWDLRAMDERWWRRNGASTRGCLDKAIPLPLLTGSHSMNCFVCVLYKWEWRWPLKNILKAPFVAEYL